MNTLNTENVARIKNYPNFCATFATFSSRHFLFFHFAQPLICDALCKASVFRLHYFSPETLKTKKFERFFLSVLLCISSYLCFDEEPLLISVLKSPFKKVYVSLSKLHQK